MRVAESQGTDPRVYALRLFMSNSMKDFMESSRHFDGGHADISRCHRQTAAQQHPSRIGTGIVQ
ncbi:MAG: hypothetical protein EBZ06_10485 [Betaproteobacteria bacterium]|nr:hypothetical protein [Betaproteobacteria bacterium]NBQ09291.1 hypothetical protein [Betaproteobacteria bacterium]NCV25469.1 hypothetical protein [Betaproteobacteria bacterium]NCV54907.1 hypothetical protein [Betaproteobacteria bacterium]NCW97433.1 hypothetical protein [Betaproteobacteria bacterium]